MGGRERKGLIVRERRNGLEVRQTERCLCVVCVFQLRGVSLCVFADSVNYYREMCTLAAAQNCYTHRRADIKRELALVAGVPPKRLCLRLSVCPRTLIALLL